jgi:hypothetical protein
MFTSLRTLIVVIAVTAGVNWWLWASRDFAPNSFPHAIEGHWWRF